ncbi:MAG TPA: MbcA/ParS/Xre antitoxin family protein [Rhizomicrobium sp.]|jgi:uncharacterized protein (DUF2384 family)
MNVRPANLDHIAPSEPLPDEGDILQDAAQIFSNPQEWLKQAHPMLGGRSPQQCLDAQDEQPVRDLLRRIRYIGQT